MKSLCSVYTTTIPQTNSEQINTDAFYSPVSRFLIKLMTTPLDKVLPGAIPTEPIPLLDVNSARIPQYLEFRWPE